MITTTIHLSDILKSQRIDVAYYKDNSGTNDFVSLSKYVDIKGGKRVPKDKSFSFESTNYLYLRLSDISDFECINYSALKNIDEELFNILKRYEICNNVIVFSIAGTIGRVFVVKNIPEGKRVILTENCAKLLPKNDNVLPEYVSLLLNCDFVQKQIEQNRIQTTIPKIGLDRIAKLKVPKLPSFSNQQKIVRLYQEVQIIRLKKGQESWQLLNSIDEYLLGMLQIDRKVRETYELPSVQRLSSLIGGRFDPQQFHSERMKMIEQIKMGKWCRLKDVVNNVKMMKFSISSGEIYVGLENIESETGEYISSSEKTSISSAAQFKEGFILFPKLRPYLNKVYRAQFDGCCSTEFHVFEAHDINPDFLTIVLRSSIVLAQTKHLMTGNTLPRLQTTDIANLIIPYPSMKLQEEIVDSVFKIKGKAKRLRTEGESLLNEAKQKIEKLILE